MKQSVIAGVILCLIGIAMVGMPGSFWKLAEKWKSDGSAAPSKTYLTVIRCLGGVFIGVGVLLEAGILH